MNKLVESLVEELQDSVLETIQERIRALALAIELETDGTFSSEKVLQIWTDINQDLVIKRKTPTPRVKTDKVHKCGEEKKAGIHRGQPCGKNAVLGYDRCMAHLAQEDKEKVRQELGETNSPTTELTHCKHVMITGPNRGYFCGKKTTGVSIYCSTHFVKHTEVKTSPASEQKVSPTRT
jgi:hypothetical protein